jgi:hypothetical protein
LTSLIHYIQETRSAEEVTDWARARIDDPLFALTLITARRGEVRNAAGRHLQLSWDRLIDLLGEQTVVDLIEQLPDDEDWARALSPDEMELLRQARVFAADPAAALRHMEDYRRQSF